MDSQLKYVGTILETEEPRLARAPFASGQPGLSDPSCPGRLPAPAPQVQGDLGTLRACAQWPTQAVGLAGGFWAARSCSSNRFSGRCIH